MEVCWRAGWQVVDGRLQRDGVCCELLSRGIALCHSLPTTADWITIEKNTCAGLVQDLVCLFVG